MKNKFKLLVTLFTVLIISCVASACNIIKEEISTPPVTYTITFVDYDGTEISSTVYEEGSEVTAPAAPTRAESEGYSYEFAGWDKEVGVATEDTTYTATYVSSAITYNVTFMAGDAEVAKLGYTVENKNVTAPEVPAKEHYTGAWESYELTVGDLVVNAVYTPVNYTVTFMNGDAVVEEITYNAENYTTMVAPAVPAKAGYEGVWGAYDFATLTNQTVQVDYTAIVYTASFMADGVLVGEVEFTVEDLELDAPTVPKKAHYTGVWGETEFNYADVVVNAVYTPVDYTITFMNGEVKVGEAKFNIENKNVTAPEVPEKVGHTGVWGYDCEKLEDQVATLTYTANVYKITYDAQGGTATEETQEVVYGEEYTLAQITKAPKVYQEILGWYDAEGNKAKAGTWELTKDITLTAKYSNGLSFETLDSVPAFLTGANTAGTLAITSTTASDGNKCLVIPVTGGAPSLKITMAALADFFADPSVEYVAFDARTDQTETSNFRRYTLRTNGALGNECYEPDQVGYNCGIRKYWKTFYFSRTDYEVWQERGIEAAGSNYIIIPGGFISGDNLYVDNMRPVSKSAIYDFEGGGLRTGSTIYYYNPIYIGNWAIAITGGKITSSEMTSNASSGKRALQFTKTAGEANLYVPKKRMMLEDLVGTDGANWIAVDLYVPEGSDATVTRVGSYGSAWPITYNLVKGAWNTIYVLPGLEGENFIKITDTTGGTYIIDNIRIVPGYEAGYGFEYAGSGLRTKEIASGVFYYFGANGDHQANRYSIAFTGGVSNARIDTNAHSGNFSLAFDKTAKNVIMQTRGDSILFKGISGGMSLWIYSTVELDGVNSNEILNGLEKKIGGTGIIVPANTWTKIVLTKDDIKELTAEQMAKGAAAPFLRIYGEKTGTIYVDDIRPF